MKLKIVSDGTNAGTKLFDEDSGEMVHLIQKLTWKATSSDFITYISVDLMDIPVDIKAKAVIILKKWNHESFSFEDSESFIKEVRIISTRQFLKNTEEGVMIYDAETNTQMGGIQEITFSADPNGPNVKIVQIDIDSIHKLDLDLINKNALLKND